MEARTWRGARVVLVILLAALATPAAAADAVIEWDATTGDLIAEAKLPPAAANRLMALVQTAVFRATNAITRRYRERGARLEAPAGASVDAAVASASRAALVQLLPAQQAAIERAYLAALAKVEDGPARAAGVAVGERAAQAVLAERADDGAAGPERYRPRTTPGIYVVTVLPVALSWPQRRPWLLSSPDQFRPGPPPPLDGALWARDLAEVKAMGARSGSRRTAEQTEVARFWEATQPPIYHGVLRSVASAPGRDITRNARLFAAAAQAMDDALIAVFDAKYHYEFWRPITAIRNADADGNDATERDPSWTPLIDTPLHPEYPCAHCIVAAAVGAVLRAELGDGPTPRLTTTSPTAGGASRSWSRIDDLVKEVAEARIWDGVHYRNSTEVGTAMGRRIGELAASRWLDPGSEALGERDPEPRARQPR